MCVEREKRSHPSTDSKRERAQHAIQSIRQFHTILALLILNICDEVPQFLFAMLYILATYIVLLTECFSNIRRIHVLPDACKIFAENFQGVSNIIIDHIGPIFADKIKYLRDVE